MGKSVDFCHIIIISAIITVYRTAGRPEFSARLYCTGRENFSRSELQEVLQYYQVMLWIKQWKYANRERTLIFVSVFIFVILQLHFPSENLPRMLWGWTKKNKEWNVNELVIMFVVRPFDEKGTCGSFISDIAWNNHDSRTGYNLPSRNTKRPEYILIKRSLLCKIQTDSARDYGKNEDEFN